MSSTSSLLLCPKLKCISLWGSKLATSIILLKNGLKTTILTSITKKYRDNLSSCKFCYCDRPVYIMLCCHWRTNGCAIWSAYGRQSDGGAILSSQHFNSSGCVNDIINKRGTALIRLLSALSPPPLSLSLTHTHTHTKVAPSEVWVESAGAEQTVAFSLLDAHVGTTVRAPSRTRRGAKLFIWIVLSDDRGTKMERQEREAEDGERWRCCRDGKKTSQSGWRGGL